jgi:ribosomal protein L12E/L44/L45/RPP1/RPP2
MKKFLLGFVAVAALVSFCAPAFAEDAAPAAEKKEEKKTTKTKKTEKKTEEKKEEAPKK